MIVEVYYSKRNQKIGGTTITDFIIRNPAGEEKVFTTLKKEDVSRFDMSNCLALPCSDEYMYAMRFKKVLVDGKETYTDTEIGKFLMCENECDSKSELNGFNMMGYSQEFDSHKHIEVEIRIYADNRSWAWQDTIIQN